MKPAPAGEKPVLVLFRHDLRMEDQPALHAACESGAPVVPVFIWDLEAEGPWSPGGASLWWLHHSLLALQGLLEKAGSRLVLRQGVTLDVIRQLVAETSASAVFWNRRYEPNLIERDRQMKAALRDEGLLVRSFNSALLAEPMTVSNKAGNPFQVFTPMYRHYLEHVEPSSPLPAPRRLPSPRTWPTSERLVSFGLQPIPNWAGGLAAAWRPGSAGAQAMLDEFEEDGAAAYPDRRDLPGQKGTSRLSPHLHFGEISPRVLWHRLHERASTHAQPGLARGAEAWLRQLVWREFAHHLLFHFPRTPFQPLRPEFESFPWRRDSRALKAWQKGRTGYPIVDAGMRELWTTGWMHNRVRMIVGSFLVKDLLIPWVEGARWFWDTLVDADLANNTLGWQWVAGCGADAAPYFRIFNPVLQARKFDPTGAYVRRWVPELSRLPDADLHAPWEAAALTLKEAGVTLGKTYPRPIVDHHEARDRALEALSAIRKP